MKALNYTKKEYHILLDVLNQVIYDDIYFDNSSILLLITKTEEIIESLNQ